MQECLQGREQAWSALIEKYKNLIYSIPIKYHATPEDAADIFQAVCLELFSELSRLRNADSLSVWIVTVATHKAFHWKRRQQRQSEREMRDWEEARLEDALPVSPVVLEELEQEQKVREAVAQLPSRCRELIQLLFYEHPPVPYQAVAKQLGLATGSLGFIRGRCLNRLQKVLEKMGF